MTTWTTQSPPSWAKNAVATDRGWVDPSNGQILVACKRIENATPYSDLFNKGGKPKKKKRGGARPGAGRKSNAERERLAAKKAAKPKAKKAPAKKKALTKKPTVKVKASVKAETPVASAKLNLGDKDDG